MKKRNKTLKEKEEEKKKNIVLPIGFLKSPLGQERAQYKCKRGVARMQRRKKEEQHGCRKKRSHTKVMIPTQEGEDN